MVLLTSIRKGVIKWDIFLFFFCFVCLFVCFLYKMVAKYHVVPRKASSTANGKNIGNFSRGQSGKIEQKDLKMYVCFVVQQKLAQHYKSTIL